MYCRILDYLYVRTNGFVPCDDDYGQGRILGTIENSDEFNLDNLFCNDNYKHIDDSFSKGTVPWKECSKCALLNQMDFKRGIYLKKISHLQIEPSLKCGLLCSECSRIGWLKSGYDQLLDYKLFKKLMSNIKNSGYDIGSIIYCGQGDPLTHPKISSFLNYSRNIFPSTFQQIVTNGNYKYNETLTESYADEIIVSCDGSCQSSYEKYRKNGLFSTVINFMSDVKKYSPKTNLIWKYILFEHNDENSEIIEAQKIASDLGVDKINFIFTSTKNKSKKYEPDNTENFPITISKAQLISHEMLNRVDIIGVPITPNDSRSIKNSEYFQNYFVIDVLFLTKIGEKFLLHIRGWALNKNGTVIKTINFSANNKMTSDAQLNIKRPDVEKFFSQHKSGNYGFNLNKYVSSFVETVDVKAKIILDNGQCETHEVSYTLKRLVAVSSG